MTGSKTKSGIKKLVSVKKKELLYVFRAWKDHGSTSGMRGLIRHISGVPFIQSDAKLGSPYRVFKWLAGRAGNRRYNSLSAGLEFATLKMMLLRRPKLVHFLYGEYDLHYIPYLSHWLRIPIIASFHNPSKELESSIANSEHLKKLTGIVILGENQRKYFEKHCPNVAIECILLGVDTKFFQPTNNSILNCPQVCIVGVHLRDWELIRKFVYTLHSLVPELKVTFVVSEAFDFNLPREPWIQNAYPVSLEKLKTIYQESSFMFFAPLDCVASNAVLEALACGIPIIAPHVGAVTEYLDQGCSFLFPRDDLKSMVLAGVELIHNTSLRSRMSQAARQRSLQNDWSGIDRKYVNFYREIGFIID